MTHPPMLAEEIPEQQMLPCKEHSARIESQLRPAMHEKHGVAHNVFGYIPPSDRPLLLTKPAGEEGSKKPLQKHGVASGYFGFVPQSDQPLPTVSKRQAEDLFMLGMLDRPMEQGHRNPIDWAVAVGIHILIVTAVVVVPLLFTQAIDLHSFQVTYLELPKPPAAAPAPAPPVVQKVARPVRNIAPSRFTAPITIPKTITIVRDEGLPDINAGGVIGGIPGGESGGALGGILGGTGNGPAPPMAATRPEKGTVLRVGGDVKPPRQILRIEPRYPLIAMHAHADGVVVIEAVIDEHGNVIQVHALSGPGLLIEASLEAVRQWKYEPTYLNGVPVSIAMNVQVVYSLRSYRE
jgi:periplasmic protein TonB